LTAIEQLKAEVLQMQTVNFKKYADIIVNLQMKNDSYYLMKRFDDDTLDHIRSQFDKESGLAFMDRCNRLSDEKIVQLQKESVPPESEKCQQVVKEYWGLMLKVDFRFMSKSESSNQAEKQLFWQVTIWRKWKHFTCEDVIFISIYCKYTPTG